MLKKPQPVGDFIPHLFKYFCENLWLGWNWKLKSLPSQSLTWNLKMAPLNGRVLLETIISRFHITPGECIWNHKFATTSAYPSYQAQPLISSPILPTPGQLCQLFSLTVWPIFSQSFKYPWWHLVGKIISKWWTRPEKSSRNQDRIKDILWRVPEIAKEVDSQQGTLIRSKGSWYMKILDYEKKHLPGDSSSVTGSWTGSPPKKNKLSQENDVSTIFTSNWKMSGRII